MEVILSGTGTSQGVPVIGCDCTVCKSTDTHNVRLRTAAIIQMSNGLNIQIDCGPDFRQQILANDIHSLEHILLTHEHMDHIAGMDDVRAFNFSNRVDMNVYGTGQVLARIRHHFDYAFSRVPYPGAPRIVTNVIDSNPFQLNDVIVQPIPVWHGKWPVMGFRIGNFAYITDVNAIPASSLELLTELDVLVLGVLHQKQHHSHYHLEEGIKVAKLIGANRTIFTHISHQMGLHDEVSAELPTGIELGYDGMRIHVHQE
ncbi:MBL fold metallo-hydrolase [Phaeocystidibacter marisrubri]|uniref:MBL fold metallo-hydrolase n=1 Tax=Phaeocystidibacter marisrubri TaxID=1577780 RepID=A0A6L3ZJZ9_9FLAO|nr:MBL fold metallo-hydrolase [Phaeocystidibacter marisrubri]KAB2817745.1 MBL fold metallo-hydrolase [Phaeocystidibacter marisrubri]